MLTSSLAVAIWNSWEWWESPPCSRLSNCLTNKPFKFSIKPICNSKRYFRSFCGGDNGHNVELENKTNHQSAWIFRKPISHRGVLNMFFPQDTVQTNLLRKITLHKMFWRQVSLLLLSTTSAESVRLLQKRKHLHQQ